MRIYPNYCNMDYMSNKSDIHPTYIIMDKVPHSFDDKVHIRIDSYSTNSDNQAFDALPHDQVLISEYSDITLGDLVKSIDSKYVGDPDKEGKQVIDLRFASSRFLIEDTTQKYNKYNTEKDDHYTKINYLLVDMDKREVCITTESFAYDVTATCEKNDIIVTAKQHIQLPIPKYDYDTEMATMGSCDGDEVITYKLDGELFVESFERAWDRIVNFYGKDKVQRKNRATFLKTPGLLIYDSYSDGFTKVKHFIRNDDIGVWNRVIFNDRVLLLTDDHPLPTLRGRIFVKDMVVGDQIPKVNIQYSEINSPGISEDFAWLLGTIICDGCYANSGVSLTFGLDEYDIATRAASIIKSVFDVTPVIKEHHRGVKGNYVEVAAYDRKIAIKLAGIFEGINKNDRKIPSAVFNRFSYREKAAFLCGMIDADGYIRDRGDWISIGSVNHELAIQQALLAQSLGIPTKIMPNWYKGKDYPENIRYVVYIHKAILNDQITSNKKRTNNANWAVFKISPYSTVRKIEKLGYRGRFGYDVETESDHFDVSGINSHNCRTLLSYDVNGMGYKKTGRGNVTPCTMNLARIGIRHGICLGERDKADVDGFFKELDHVLDLTEKELVDRFNYICSQNIRSGFFMYNNGTIAGSDKVLETGKIFEAMKHGTNAFGYIGIANACYAMFGKYQNQSKEALDFAIKVVETIKKRAAECTEKYHLNFGVYATPAESTCKTLAYKLQKEYGKIKGVCDRSYLTNSHHVPVFVHSTIRDKVECEANFAWMASSGCITYTELESGVIKNPKAVEKIIDMVMADNRIPYFAINFPIDTCNACGYSGEILDKCPVCGSDDITRLRRVTGYLTQDYRRFNKGKFDECNDRVKHGI